jgi:ATP-dependent Clp protease ATP-binding subunit ClpC
VIFFARYEASQFGASAIEAEHILLGLLREDRALVKRFFLDPSSAALEVREQLEERLGIKPKVSTSVDMPLSLVAKHVLQHAWEESEQLQHRYIRTEHLLLGLLREKKSLAAELLGARGITLDEVRRAIGGDEEQS